MNFRDRYVTDEEGSQILFTVEMQRRLSKAGLPVEIAYLDQIKQSATAAAKTGTKPSAK